MPDKSPLRQLVDIISASVDQIENHFAQCKLQYPTLDASFNPTSPAETASTSPQVVQAAQLVVAACGQLSAVVKVPSQSLYEIATGFHLSSCLRVACHGNIAEILREGGDQGLHTDEIAAKSGLDPAKQARVLRTLATHHVFRETSPDVFTNNRLSSVLDTFKSVSEIKANPEEKHVGALGSGALYEHICDEMFKGSALMTETLFDPVTGHSEDQEHAPMMVAFASSKNIWDWFEEPENKLRHKRFGAAMVGSSRLDPPEGILQGFDWSELPPRSVVVDVGGGIGSTSIKVAKKFPGLQYVVQDRPATIEDAKEYWKSNSPKMLDDGSVKLQVHDFFTPQPIKNAAVFLLRKIIHDHGYVKAVAILKHLRDAATPETKLLMIDHVVPFACLDDITRSLENNIQGAEVPDAPGPLLPNLGKGNALAYLGDFQMLVGLNGEERTLRSFVDITCDSGWKIQRVFKIHGSPNRHIVAVPA